MLPARGIPFCGMMCSNSVSSSAERHVQGNVVHGQQAIRRGGPIWSFQLGGGEMELSMAIRAGDREATDSKRPNQIALTPVNASDTP